MSNMIWVTFQREGIHFYPDAPEEVSFLRNPHRHVFHFKVWIEVYHNNRDVEFFIFKRWLESMYHNNLLQLDYKSCEMLADELSAPILLQYPNRKVIIEVSEDLENGCYKEYA